MILIALAGLLLNHSDDLGLPQGYVSNNLARHLYGIETPPVDAVFEAAGLLIVSAANTVYSGDAPIATDAGTVRGALANNDMIIIATDREFILTTSEGALIERSEIAPAQQVIRIGLAGSRVVVASGNGRFEFDIDRMQLSALDLAPANITWSESVELDDEQLRRMGTATAGQIISWERVLIDLHSGRILPVVGRYLFDITALCLLYLCLSGVLLWFRRR